MEKPSQTTIEQLNNYAKEVSHPKSDLHSQDWRAYTEMIAAIMGIDNVTLNMFWI